MGANKIGLGFVGVGCSRGRDTAAARKGSTVNTRAKITSKNSTIDSTTRNCCSGSGYVEFMISNKSLSGIRRLGTFSIWLLSLIASTVLDVERVGGFAVPHCRCRPLIRWFIARDNVKGARNLTTNILYLTLTEHRSHRLRSIPSFPFSTLPSPSETLFIDRKNKYFHCQNFRSNSKYIIVVRKVLIGR